MTQYLVVAHQTANSPELLERLCKIADDDPSAGFTLLVPATPVNHLLTWEEGETHTIARKTAAAASALFEAHGLDIADASVGDGAPILAIADELRAHPGQYDGIVLSTWPPGVSRWLHLDVHNQAERKFDLPVIHVVAQRRVKVRA
ncbi:MAG: hypothetical protein ACE5Q6_14165 [Dehalococcoidia bacterium]